MRDSVDIINEAPITNMEDQAVLIGIRQFPMIATCRDGDIEALHSALFHSAVEIQFVTEGKCSYFVKDSVWECESNSVLVIHSNEMHNYLPGSCKSLKRFSLIIGDEVLKHYRNISEMINGLRDVRQIDLPEKDAILSRIMLEDVIKEIRGREVLWMDAALACVARFLVILTRCKTCHTKPRGEINQFVLDMVQYLDKHATRKIPLDELTKRFCISRYWMSRKFHQATGSTIRDYIIRRRISLAKTLLENTDSKVCSIAINVGFDDLSAFNRNFKMVTGITPSQYRKLLLQKGNNVRDIAGA